jgi:hypothetical protein
VRARDADGREQQLARDDRQAIESMCQARQQRQVGLQDAPQCEDSKQSASAPRRA